MPRWYGTRTRRATRILDTCREMRSRRRSAAPPAIDLPLCRDTGVRHVGVVFVHGIGSQAQGEILRDWGDAIAEGPESTSGSRPASTATRSWRHSWTPRRPGALFVELQLPAARTAQPAVPGAALAADRGVVGARDHAARPSGTMARWLGPGGAVRASSSTIIPRSSRRRRPARAGRALRSPTASPCRRCEDLARADAAAAPPGMRERARRAMARPAAGADGPRPATGWSEPGAWAYLQAARALLLLVYGVLRSIESLIPIGPLAQRRADPADRPIRA